MGVWLDGQSDFTFEPMAAATPQFKRGKVLALEQRRAKRSKTYPWVPTMQEEGFAGFDTMNWYGISGPANLPTAVVRRINADVNTVLAMPWPLYTSDAADDLKRFYRWMCATFYTSIPTKSIELYPG